MTTEQPTTRRDHHTRVTVTRATNGWEVSEERDSHVVRRVSYRDWHRVERALQVFDLQSQESQHWTRVE